MRYPVNVATVSGSPAGTPWRPSATRLSDSFPSDVRLVQYRDRLSGANCRSPYGVFVPIFVGSPPAADITHISWPV